MKVLSGFVLGLITGVVLVLAPIVGFGCAVVLWASSSDDNDDTVETQETEKEVTP